MSLRQLSAWSLAIAAASTGCMVGSGLQGGGGGGGDGGGSSANGLVTSPTPGTVITGDTSSISIHVAGTYTGSSQLDIQVLSDPTDLTSWTTLQTVMPTAVTADSSQSFAADVVPVDSAADAGRWPAGGVLRIQVIEDATGSALPYDSTDSSLTTIAVASPLTLPTKWQFLLEKAAGSDGETEAYYTAITAPATLTDFQTQYGFGGSNEAHAKYYNAGDLGIGRDMHCVATTSPAGGQACYVTNYGTFGGAESDAISALEAGTTPLATVAMIYTPPITSPNAVTFMVYGATGKLSPQAQLDTVGNNTSIPQNCLNCHGGQSTYDSTAHAATGAKWLQFDPNAFDFPTDNPSLTFVAQAQQLQALDALAMQAAPTAAETEVINGSWGTASFDGSFVPTAWSDSAHDQTLYSQVLAPYCRGCHLSVDSGNLTFQTPDDLRGNAAKIVSKVCGDGPTGMPTAEQTATRFFASGARALLLEWLGQPGACNPQ